MAVSFHSSSSSSSRASSVSATAPAAASSVAVAASSATDPKTLGLELQALVEHAFRGKEPHKPTFVLSYGPPGSGKTYVIERVLPELDPKKTVFALVDEWVWQFPAFQHELKEANSTITDSAALEETRRNLYYKYRALADVVNDAVIYRALAERFDVVFETTGNRLTWSLPFLDKAQRQGYHTLALYPWAPASVLRTRVAERAARRKQWLTQFPAESIENAQNNLIQLSRKADRILIYDNSREGAPLQVMDFRHLYQSLDRGEQFITVCPSCRTKIFTEASGLLKAWLRQQCQCKE